MDPLSTAIAAFTAVKAGVKLGKDAHGLYKDIAKMWGAIEEVKNDHSKQKNSVKNKLMSVEEEAMESFIAKKKAEDLEKQLREIIIYTRGMNGWQELLKMRADIKRKRAEERKLAKMKHDEFVEMCAIGFLIAGLIAAAGAFVWFVLLSQNTV